MRSELRSAIDKAKESIEVAKKLHHDGHYDFAVARAYYAMFYLAEAALQTKGLVFSSHQAVISGFARHFVRQGIFSKQLHRSLSRMFTLRVTGDYGSYQAIPQQKSAKSLDEATTFVSRLTDYLNRFLETPPAP